MPEYYVAIIILTVTFTVYLKFIVSVTSEITSYLDIYCLTIKHTVKQNKKEWISMI